MDKDKKFLLVRLNKEQHDFLKGYSKSQNRSMSGQLVFAVEELKQKFEGENEHTTVP